MPSFTCDHCQETLKKAQLEKHAMRCYPASFSCIDCYKTFRGNEHKAHTSCITEVEKYHEKKITSVPITQNNQSKNNQAGNTSETISKKEKNSDSFKYSWVEKDLKKLFEDGTKELTLKKVKKALQKKHSKKIVKKFMEECFAINPLKEQLKILH